MSNCKHASVAGIDLTPLDDPDKLWRCDGCGWLHRYVRISDCMVRAVPADEGA